ncbi:TPA: ABC transporter ATP-binding protein [Klebsiella oxytoca]|jgi:sulfonate transport system ATP-binding protein|nr:ABC transporter ATP-binding protein [Citrobacter freundii]HBM2877347.1 ABC transporter ATP-binding protein [Klebsiella oxytoca]HBU8667803.1 ABC transporter ATP-binding protein [Klebsiella oxytoca]
MTITGNLNGENGRVTVRDLTKKYYLNQQALTVLEGLNLDIHPGKCLAIVGASGSGKTTLLRILAGLENPDKGHVQIDGKIVKGVGVERAVIFQEPRLLPWLTVLENVAFGLEVRGEAKKTSKASALRYLDLVGLSDFCEAYPRQLSGGMAQRVGIARALAVRPKILLLDEPLGALDAMTKISMQEELARIWHEEQVTMVIVTHDLEEAIFMGDQVLVLPKLREGKPRIINVDLPRPRDRTKSGFVAYREELMKEFGLH